MRRPWLALLLLAGVVWALNAYWWSHARGAWRPPAAIQPALPEPPQPFALGATTGVRQALARPLFWSSRRPVASTDDSAVDGELRQARLVAVLESGPDRIALLQRPDGSALKIASGASGSTPGAAASRWRLDRFDGRVAHFIHADGRGLDLRLERSAGPVPGAAPIGESARRTAGQRQAPGAGGVPGLPAHLPAAHEAAEKPRN